MSYRDAPAAIEWLCSHFGFEKHLIVPGDNNVILHAQLTMGSSGMIMLGSSGKDTGAYSKLIKQPEDIGGCETQTVCLVVADADVIYQRVKQAGTEILIDIKDEDYGGRSFTCRDLEGHIWTIGTYDPYSYGG
jgi:uncharacterized glyoxalase superfamily protein PhnB